MAVPDTTARLDPTDAPANAIPLADGFSTKVAFSVNNQIQFWEKTVQVGGYDGGDSVPQTTMFNTQYMTKAPQTLIDTTDGSGTAAYDPQVLQDIIALINVRGSVTYHFPDGSTKDVFAYLKEFTPQPHEKGTMPEANFVIVETNWDPVNNVEQGPVITQVAGT